MRSKDLGIIPGVSKEFSREETLAMFEKICISRCFEANTKNAFDAKRIKTPIYLSLGQEAVSSALAVAYPKPFIFAQHRSHDFYLAYGGNLAALIDELLHQPTGCAKGMGGSASIHSPATRMFGHSGLMGDQIPISVGFALGSGKNTLAVMGDASAEEDYILSAMGYASHKKLPILFVCNDNGLSILTKVEVRRNWRMRDLAAALGMRAVEITDDPWLVMHHAREFAGQLPAFMNVHTVRHLWHAGTGKDFEPEWDRLALIKEELGRLGLGAEAKAIEEKTKSEIDAVWQERLSRITSS